MKASSIGCLVVLLCLSCSSKESAPLDCPEYPEQVSSELREQVEGDLGSLSSIVKVRFNLEFEIAADNLYEAYTEADELLLRQTLLAAACGVVNQGELPSDEKQKRWNEASAILNEGQVILLPPRTIRVREAIWFGTNGYNSPCTDWVRQECDGKVNCDLGTVNGDAKCGNPTPEDLQTPRRLRITWHCAAEGRKPFQHVETFPGTPIMIELVSLACRPVQ